MNEPLKKYKELAKKLRHPGNQTDQLISEILGIKKRPWTQSFRIAETLIPADTIFVLSHNDDRSFYWADVTGTRYSVQGWGTSPECALAAAGVAYRIDPRYEIASYQRLH